ncbi:PEP-CTERM sorting domain-containing protein [Massilia sp. W12]|uniref:PEP-CTERM sorting domain-containing protein n=1 Tax=Massilia sp. W12 TaxID=3126507 RepID=UPI0030D0128D
MKYLVACCIAALLPQVSQAVELYDNGPVVNANGKSAISGARTAYGYAVNSSAVVADDFKVSDNQVWNIGQFDFFAYQTNATNFGFQSVTWSLVKDLPDGTEVMASGTTSVSNGGLVGHRVLNDSSTSTARKIYRLQADVQDFNLSAGHYWLRWSITGNSSFSGPWVPQTADGRDGNGQQNTGNGWADIDTLTADLPFAVHGTVAVVPEAETWAMMLAGLGGLGMLARRRRQA